MSDVPARDRDQDPLTDVEIREIGKLAANVGRQLSEFEHAAKSLQMVAAALSELRETVDFATKKELEEMQAETRSKLRRYALVIVVVVIVVIGNVWTIQTIRESEEQQSCAEATDLREIIEALAPDQATKLPPLPEGCR